MRPYNISIFQQKVRQCIRKRRQMLTVAQQKYFAYNAAVRLIKCISIKTLCNVALFLSFDGELDTNPLIHYFWNIGKNVYLPSLHPCNLKKLIFLRYYSHTKLILNRLNIYEPKFYVQDVLPIYKLDLLIIPLVAFNTKGQRLGMGGGFYDYTLQNWQRYDNLQLIGYAHDCQLVHSLCMERWDISLPAIVTPSRLWLW